MRTIILFYLTTFLFISCSQETKDKTILPSSSGNPGEVLVIMEEKHQNTNVETALKELFEANQVGLPNDEPIFDMMLIPPMAFKNVFIKHRNIVSIKIGSKYTESKISIRANIFAQPQYYMELTAPDDRSFVNLLHTNGGKILGQFHKAELERIQSTYSIFANSDDMATIKKKYNIELNIPSSYKMTTSADDFIWISHEQANISQGVFIYFYPYTDTIQLTENELVKTRNAFLKKYVPGPRDSSYMTTEVRTDLHFKEGKILNKKYTTELRGLWRVEGDYMGGPFISLTSVDEERNRIVTIESFVYAPKYKKREYLRQTEAIIKTLTFSKKTEETVTP